MTPRCHGCGRRHRSPERRRECKARARWNRYWAVLREHLQRCKVWRRRVYALRAHAASSREVGQHEEASAFAAKAVGLVRKYRLRDDPDDGYFLSPPPFASFKDWTERAADAGDGGAR